MSTVILDTITGKSTATTITIGSTPVISASANSMTIRGEGSAQTSIQQGLCKAWIKLNGGTFGLLDSFNTASVTDNGTGDYTMTVSNAFGNINYNFVGATDGDGTNGAALYKNNQVAATTTVLRVRTKLLGNQSADRNEIGVSLFGDLA